MPNPFAPKRRPQLEPAPVPEVADRVELHELLKHELVELARERGLDDTGTKADLIARLRD